MKLINPTDDQLNAAFAEKVAGWKLTEPTPGAFGGTINPYWVDDKGIAQFDGPWFAYSADAVLPWLEKGDWFPVIRRPWGNIVTGGRTWEVELSGTLGESKNRAYAETFAKALVISLLRAHGVEIEFTKP